MGKVIPMVRAQNKLPYVLAWEDKLSYLFCRINHPISSAG
jgi:hypothetical protein